MAAAAALLFVRSQEPALPVYGTLPDLELVDQDGKTFGLAQTRGKVVVLGLIYTHCPDICPLITLKLKAIQERLNAEGLGDQVVFVTVTFDPERDRPEVLRRYAQAYGLDLRNWRFLTGARDSIDGLTDILGFYTERTYGVARPATSDPSGAEVETPYLITHSDRFYVIDRQGNIRASLPGSRTDTDAALRVIRKLTGGL